MVYELSAAEMQELQRELHIDLLGVTTADPFTDLEELLLRHQAQGYASGFEHPHIAERVQPAATLPGARSIVAIAMAYHTEKHQTLQRPPGVRGVLSKYAWGKDYHILLRKKLDDLAWAMEKKLGRSVHYHASVDTGPLVDRAVAERAGIGWYGKNCMIITEDFGSWVFLGQLVCDVAIEPFLPHQPSRCGPCERCIKACPTGAIVAPYTIDSSRCLAFITQMKGMIPREYRRKIGSRIWGCDTCQMVCPANREVRYAQEEFFSPQAEWSFPQLIDLLHMSNKQFQRMFGETAAAWRGLTVLKRNAIIALGNRREGEAIPHLLPFLHDPRSELRGTTVWALGTIGEEEVWPEIAALRRREKDPLVLEEIAYWATML